MKNRRGFTLAELLVVVAVIGVLVAVSIPIFTGQLRRSRAAVDQANVRSGKAAAVVQYLTDGSDGTKEYFYDAASGTVKDKADGIEGYGKSTENLPSADGVLADDYADNIPKDGDTAHIVKITITDGAVSAEWLGENTPTPASPSTEPSTTPSSNPNPEPSTTVSVEEAKNQINSGYAVLWDSDYMSKLGNIPNVKNGALVQDGEKYYYTVSGSIRVADSYKLRLENKKYAIPVIFPSSESGFTPSVKSELPQSEVAEGTIMIAKDSDDSEQYYTVYYKGSWNKVLTMDEATQLGERYKRN